MTDPSSAPTMPSPMLTDDYLTGVDNTIKSAIRELEDLAAQAVDDDLVAATKAAELLGYLSKFVSGANRGLRTRIALALPDRINQVGPFEVECTFSRNRSKFQHDSLFKEIVQRAMNESGVSGMPIMDSGTGEVLGTTTDDVAKIIADEFKDVLGIDYYRVKKMKQRFGSGFDIDRYCKSEAADPSVIIRPRAVA